MTRGLTTLVAAGIAGVLLWLATQVGVGSVTSFWESMALVAAAGFVVALSQAVGGWAKGGRLRISPTTFLLGFVPVLVCAGWILMATQPGSGWHEGTVASWSRSAGILGLVHALGLWHGVLAFGLGLMLGLTLDAAPVPVAEPVAVTRRERVRDDVRDVPAEDETAVADGRGPRLRRRRGLERDADEPMQSEREAAYDETDGAERRRAERDAAYDARPRTTTGGPGTRRTYDDEE